MQILSLNLILNISLVLLFVVTKYNEHDECADVLLVWFYFDNQCQITNLQYEQCSIVDYAIDLYDNYISDQRETPNRLLFFYLKITINSQPYFEIWKYPHI